MNAKKLPIGIQNFKKLREADFFYVDKTDLIHQLVENGQYYFLSRPHRFGKSLLLSTIQSYFQGPEECFEGLAIDRMEHDRSYHAIFHLDLSAEQYNAPERLDAVLNDALSKWECVYGDWPTETSFALRFKGGLERAARKTGNGVVVLIDEYDKPLLQALDNQELQAYYRETLKAFYGVLKSCDASLRFVLLTGVTGFNKFSVLGDLDYLMDISLDARYDRLCGLTQQELEANLRDELDELAEANQLTREEVRSELQRWYGGYRFSGQGSDIYNPFSVLNALSKKRFDNYWFEASKPTFLMNWLKRTSYPLSNLTEALATSDMLGSIDSTEENSVPFLYQNGYLTIKDYDARFGTYTLDFPNREVEDGITRHLFPYYTTLVQPSDLSFEIIRLVQEIEQGSVEQFMLRLQSLFADIFYESECDWELHCQHVLFLVLKRLGFYTQVEYHTSDGRMDWVVKTKNFVYLMEFMFDGSAEEALRQIDGKHYVLSSASDSCTVYKIGANFSNEIRQLEDWMIEKA